MPEPNQYTVKPRELVELIIKASGIKEGRWFLFANFGFAPGNFGPNPAQMAPGAAVIIQGIGIQREQPEALMPPEVVVDAAELTEKKAKAEHSPPSAKPSKSKTST